MLVSELTCSGDGASSARHALWPLRAPCMFVMLASDGLCRSEQVSVEAALRGTAR